MLQDHQSNPALGKAPDDLFSAVRRGFAAVAAQADHVSINYDALPAYAAALPAVPHENALDEAHHYYGDAASTAAYILTLDSINFGSGYEPDLVAEGWALVDNSLYYTISTRLKQYFETHGCPFAVALEQITAEECAALLHLRGPEGLRFAALCSQALHQLGRTVSAQAGGDWLCFIENAAGSASRMLETLTGMAYFQDVHVYKGQHIPFYKRAQITIADLQLAFRRVESRELFADIDRLTMFADNGVPHVFHTDGILSYSADLRARIAAGSEIPMGSAEEIEIRACAGHVVELIAAQKQMSAMDVDHILWHKSAEDPRYTATKPHHTKTLFY